MWSQKWDEEKMIENSANQLELLSGQFTRIVTIQTK